MADLNANVVRGYGRSLIMPPASALLSRSITSEVLKVSSVTPLVTVGGTAQPDPLALPQSTSTQAPLSAAYNVLGVPSLAAGGSYFDPTTNVKVYKVTSATFPTTNDSMGHDYAEGGNEISLPYNGTTRAVVTHHIAGNARWLLDFTPGVGVSNPRQLTGSIAPWIDVAFTFSSNPATPWYAFVSNGSAIVRFDIRTMAAAPGDGWPVTDASAIWLHQSVNDGFFTWMRGISGPTSVGYEPSTATMKTYTNANVNEPRINRAGRHVGFSMNTPANGLNVWDWLTDTIIWTHAGDSSPSQIPFAHIGALRDRWVGRNWNLSVPGPYWKITPAVPGSDVNLSGNADNSGHTNGNWIQYPSDLDDQWAASLDYEACSPPQTGLGFLSPCGIVLWTSNGQRRLLAHPYNVNDGFDYWKHSFAKFSPDGFYLMFTSDMNVDGVRSDVFLVELPTAP